MGFPQENNTPSAATSGQFTNIVHNDNIWKNYCQGEVDSRTTWQSRWGFISDELDTLKKSQRQLPFRDVRPTNYSLAFEAARDGDDSDSEHGEKAEAGNDSERLRLPSINAHRNSSPKSSGQPLRRSSPHQREAMPRVAPAAKSQSPRRRHHRHPRGGRRPLSAESHSSASTSPSHLSTTTGRYGARAAHPLEVFGPYCKGKLTAEKSLGWPRY